MRTYVWSIGLGIFIALVAIPMNTQAGEKSAKKEVELSGRLLVRKLVNQLNSLFLEERVRAIEELSQQTDRPLVTEFAVLEKLVERAKDDTSFVRERVAALRGLITMYINKFGNTEIMTILGELAENTKTAAKVRRAALGLLGEMGDQEGPIAEKAFMTLEGLWKRASSFRGKMPIKLRIALLEAIGGFYRLPKSSELLIDAVKKSKEAPARAAAMRGLQVYVNASGSTNLEILKIAASVFKAQKQGYERIEALRIIEVLLQNGTSTKTVIGLRNSLLDLLKNGNDLEVQASVRVLMRLKSAKLHEEILAVAWPDPKRKPRLGFDTYRMINMGLFEALRQLRQTGATASTKKTAENISNHYIRLLNPKEHVPPVLRKSAVFALGSWPREFDRQKIVAVLIRLLGIEKDEEMITEIENSLEGLTDQKPFQKSELGSDVKTPDMEEWNNFFEWAKPYLEAGKSTEQAVYKGEE